MREVREVVLSSKNQILIPREVRKAQGIKPGDKLIMVADGNHWTLFPNRNRIVRRSRGRCVYPPDYLKKERESWE